MFKDECGGKIINEFVGLRCCKMDVNQINVKV